MFRNRDFRRFSIFFVLMAAVFVSLGFVINRWAGLLLLLACAVFGGAFFLFTRARMRRIAQLSKQIDLLLHNEEKLYIDEMEEGELSILSSEISKMTLRIREQNQALKGEKQRLADSLADIAHQLRTPLTSANLVLSFLADCLGERERRALVREGEALLLRMDWLLSALLKLSRLDAGVVAFQREPVLVEELLKAALAPLAIPMELRNIDFQVNVQSGMQLWGDLPWLAEALQNIFKNSMESIGENGKIQVLCSSNPLFAEILIHDSGKGFAKEDLPHLFNRFHRGKNPGNAGYGIGLALCKSIIVQQGGTIAAKNHARGGAVFVLRFPK